MAFSTTGRRASSVLAVLLATLMVSACSTTGTSVNTAQVDDNAEQLAPVQTGSVSTNALPPIGPNGEVQGSADLAAPTNGPLAETSSSGFDFNNSESIPGQLGNDTSTRATSGGSVAAIPPAGSTPNSSTRDLSGGITTEKMLGSWNIVSGGTSCQVNFTQTQSGTAGRYRASVPNCSLKGLSAVQSWAIVGTQVQLFDASGKIAAALILSGNRFIGTLSGGTGVSMVG